MKKLFIALFSIIMLGLNAQEAVPFTPFSGFYDNVRVLADKANFKQYTKFEILNEYQIIYKHSKDGLNDTVYNGSEYTKYITYYPDGKMKSYKYSHNYSPKDYNVEEYYKYDDQGRILDVETPFSMQHYYYTNTNTDSIVRMDYNKIQDSYLPSYKDVIKYTGKGYKYYSYQYIIEENRYTEKPKLSEMILDQKGRVTKVIGENGVDLAGEYIYSKYGYVYINYTQNKPYSKNEYSFNEDGYLTKESLYFWVEAGQYWSLDSTSEYDYLYNSTDNEEIRELTSKVYASNGTIMIDLKNEAYVAIYSFSGMLIKHLKLKPGIVQIPIGGGMYIVSLNGESTKIKID